jgi:hypothetical protein
MEERRESEVYWCNCCKNILHPFLNANNFVAVVAGVEGVSQNPFSSKLVITSTTISMGGRGIEKR